MKYTPAPGNTFSFNIEEGNQTVTGWNADAGWLHRFNKPGREIDLGIRWTTTHDDNSSNWRIIPATDVFSSGEMPVEESSGDDAAEQIYRKTLSIPTTA